MQQFAGIDSKRHFTVVMGDKEHGLYVSSTPSSAAKKAVTKLCAKNKGKKVEFSMREITQGSKKKTYGPYLGYIEKLKDPIELKGRIIKHKSVVKLQKKEGGGIGIFTSEFNINKTTGQLTPQAKNKMLENFKKIYINPYNLKERRFDKDTFYFGAENLIYYNGEKYFPFSICNIFHNKEDLLVFNKQTLKYEEKVNNKVLKLRILIFDPDAKQLELYQKWNERKTELEKLQANRAKKGRYLVQANKEELENLSRKLKKPLNKELLIELQEKIPKYITEYSQRHPELSQIITEQYSVNYIGLFIILEFNLLFYYQIIKLLIFFGEKLLIFPNKHFPESIKLIINIFTNLQELTPFHELFWSKYGGAMELCLREIYTESSNFKDKISPEQIKLRIESQKEKDQNQKEQEQYQKQQELYKKQQELYEKQQEFSNKLRSLCKKDYKPVLYDKDKIQYCTLKSKPEDKCCLMESTTEDKCIGCEEITVREKIENSAREVFQNTTNGFRKVGQVVQELTPRLTTPRQLENLGHRAFYTAQNVASTAASTIQAPINFLTDGVGALGNAAAKFFSTTQKIPSNGYSHFSRGATTDNKTYENWLKKKGWSKHR